MNDIGIIYCLESPSGKRYIGQTWNLKRRMSDYKICKCSDQPKIYNALKKYGSENFEMYVLDYCFDQESLDDAEIYWISYYDTIKSGYNLCTGGSEGKHSEETKKKLSRLKMGHVVTEETREKLRKSHTGKKHTLEHRRKVSEAGKGRVVSDNTRKKLSKSLKGHNVTEKTREKIRMANIGKVLSNEHRQKVIKTLKYGGFKGHSHSEETRKKIGETGCVYEYTLLSPDGVIHIVKNLNKFCNENGLILNCILVMLKGKQHQHKGWTATRRKIK